MKQIMKQVGMMVACVFALGLTGVARAADANPPERMTYQGFLVDGNGAALGNSVPANYDVVFRIYNVKSGGEPIWSEQQTVTVDKGYFSVLLGEGTGFGNEPRSEKLSTAFVGADISDRFIGITVGGLGGVDVEIAPRLRLVASPFAFTASQARNVSDGSGNRNLFREVDSSNNASLKLGAGSTPTLTLQEAGDATLAGKLTIDLPAAGVGLEIKEQGTSTKFGGLVGNRFSMSTARGGFHFDKSIYVDGDIYSFNRDARIYPSDNADNFLNVNHDGDTIDAYTDKFYVRDQGVSYLEIDPTSSDLNLLTDASSFYMNKQLDVDGTIRAFTGNSAKPGLIIDRYPTGNYRSELVQASDGLSIRVGHGSTEPTEKMRIKYDGNVWMPGWIVRTAHNTGGLMGAYSHLGGGAKASNPIYILGNSYKPNETTLGNMYGVGYTDWTASFITGTGSGWGFYVASDGDARTWLSGTSGAVSYIAKNGGRVGIGTDSPSQTLDVNGNIKLRGGAIVGSGSNYLVIEDYGSNNGCTIRPHSNNFGSIGTSSLRWDDGYITELWSSLQGSDRRIKRDINPVGKNEMLEMIDDMSFYQYRLRFPNAEKMKRQGRDANGVFYGIMAQELREIYPNVVKSNGEAALLDENETDEDEILKNRWYVEKARLAELALGGIKDLYSISKEKDSEIESLKSKVENLESEMAALKARLANSTTQEDRIAKLEELVSKIGEGQ